MKQTLAFIATIISLALTSQAAWRPGLLGGFHTAGAAQYGTAPAHTNVFLDCHAATNYNSSSSSHNNWVPIWSSNRCWQYWGQVHLPAGTHTFAGHIDDNSTLVIDGTTIFTQSGNAQKSGTFAVAEEGWFDFSFKCGNGTGGAGPWGNSLGVKVDGNTVGFGVKWNGEGAFQWLADPGNCTVFRYDDGTGFENNASFSGEPSNVAVPGVSYEIVENLAAGPVTFSVPGGLQYVSANTRATCAGYRLYDVNMETGTETLTATGAVNTVTFTHIDGKLWHVVWLWQVEHRVTATAGSGGSVSPAEQWVAPGGVATILATPDASHSFFRWTGDVTAPESDAARSATANFPVTGPMSFAAVFGDRLYVATDGDDANDGSSPALAKATVNAAVAVAHQLVADGAESVQVVVGAGEFPMTEQLILTNAVTVTGAGMGSTILVRDASVASMRIAQINHASAILEKVTLKNGKLTSSYAAGAWIRSGTVRDCEIIGCGLAHWGSGWNNGSCVRLDAATAKLLRCHLHGNSSSSLWGTGMVLRLEGGGVAESCLIYDNRNTNGSAQYTVYVGNGTLRNCTITGNSAPSTCALYLAADTSRVYDCIVFDNSGTTATTSNTIGNGFDISAANAARLAYAYNCYTGDPAFLDAANGDYRIHPASPCADAGLYGDAGTSAYDASGTAARIAGRAVDIGAYESDPGATPYVLLVPSVSTAIVGAPVTFALYSVNAGSAPLTVSFGDGTTLTTNAPSVTHAYAAAGSYLPSVSLAGAETYVFEDAIVIRPKDLYLTAGSTTGAPPYDTPATAAAYLEDALPYATSGSTVWVADGTYKFKASARISINEGVKVRGISNDPTKVTFLPFKASTHRLFRLNHADAGLYGLTLSGGYNDGSQPNYVGGGVYIDTLGGSVSNCIVCNVPGCKWGDSALAIYMAAGVVTHTVVSNIVGSSAGDDNNHQGAAIYMGGGILANSIVTDVRGGGSSSASKGGAIALAGSSKVVNCAIFGNRMTGCAGIRFNASTPQVVNTIVFNNTSTGATGDHIGVYNGTDTMYAPCFVNCAADAELNATCLWTNDLGVADAANGDYHLLASSGCRDAGTTAGIDVAATDLDGNPRIDASGLIDIGPYEVHVSGLSATIAASPSPPDGLIPLPVSFSASVEGGMASSYSWYVDGALAETTDSPTWAKTFDVPGAHVVSLKVSAGGMDYDGDNTITVNAYPATILVSPEGTAASAFPYATWATAATNIATAIDAAYDGTEIFVSNGLYRIRAAFSLSKAAKIRGLTGNPNDVVLHAQNTSTTKIGPIVTLNSADALLAGVALENGCVKQGANGGTVFINTLGGVVSNCVVRNNDKSSVGWGGRGGGVFMRGGVVTHCVISNCLASAYGDSDSYGGGSGALIYAGVLRDCLFTGNTYNGLGDDGTGKYGTVLARGGRVVNCTVTGNEARFCAGIRSEGGRIENCLSSGNRIAVPGPGTNSLVVTTVAADIAWRGSGANFSHCLTDVAIDGGADCLVEASSATFKDAAAGKYVVRATSLACDAGAAGADDSARDLAGKPRVFGKAIDIGCYECQSGSGTMLLLK